MADWVGIVDWEEGLYGVVIAAQGVRPNDDASLRGIVVHLGTVVLRIRIICDAARLAEVTIRRRLKIVVSRMSAYKVGLLPMEEIGISVEGSEFDWKAVVAPYSHPLRWGRRVGKKAVGIPMEAVGIGGGAQLEAYGINIAQSVVDIQGVSYINRNIAFLRLRIKSSV